MPPASPASKVIAAAVSLLAFISGLMIGTVEAMQFHDGVSGAALFTFAFLPAGLAWSAATARQDRARFELAFWSGLAVLSYAAFLAWRTARGSFTIERADLKLGDPLWLIPLVCAYCIFAGLVIILYSLRRP